jgi:hypothetical protein
LKVKFEAGFSLDRFKGCNWALSSYASTDFKLYSPTSVKVRMTAVEFPPFNNRIGAAAGVTPSSCTYT